MRNGRKMPPHMDGKQHFLLSEARDFLGIDVRGQWENNRFQEMSCETFDTGDSGNHETFKKNITVWLKENPLGYGLNWACPMEVAVRTANWVVAFDLLKGSAEVSGEFGKIFDEFVYSCGKHIRQNLEISVRKPVGNHYLADVAGLFFIGLLLRSDLAQAKRWLRFALREMEKCIRAQVFDDGVYFENSISYHRFALEIYLYVAIWCRKHGLELSQEYWGRLERMLEFVMHYARPDGKIPNVGDADDGIWFAFSEKVLHVRDDHRYLLALGAVLFQRRDFKALANGDREYVQRALGDEGAAAWDRLESETALPVSRDFPEGGFYFMRSGEAYLAVVTENRHPSSHMPHKHNDVFSFELCLGDAPFIIDSGTYTYTKDPEARNRFRSIAAHNTVAVDSREPNSLKKKGFFALPRDARVDVKRWQAGERHDIFEGIMEWRDEDDSVITHERKIVFDKREMEWTITDKVNGHGRHRCVSYLHFHPETLLELQERSVTCRLRGRSLSLELAGPGAIAVTERDISLRYGEKQPAACVTITLEDELPATFSMSLRPMAAGCN